MDTTAIALSSAAIIISIGMPIGAAILATRAGAATTTPSPTPEGEKPWKAYLGIGGFVLAFIGFCVSSGAISSALADSSSWATIQGRITEFTVLMMLGGAFMVAATGFFMWYAYEYSHIFLAILTALAFGLSSTALAVTSVSIR